MATRAPVCLVEAHLGDLETVMLSRAGPQRDNRGRAIRELRGLSGRRTQRGCDPIRRSGRLPSLWVFCRPPLFLCGIRDSDRGYCREPVAVEV
jgi:hypothetical protein